MPNARKFILYMARYYAKQKYHESGENQNIFSDIVKAYGLNGCQGQPWCATYQFALELMAFGKEQALKNWHMTAKDYCGFSCFETEAKFKAAGAIIDRPRQNALVIFKQSHMGRVLSTNAKTKTFECAEGNSGNMCVVKTYSWTDPSIKSFCFIDYDNDRLTKEKILGAYEAVYEMAHNLMWIYSDSHAIPPCIPDRRISCDRLPALATFILGYTSQPAGGFTVYNMERYLLSWGWKKITNQSELQEGDIILFKLDGTTAPMWKWHAFVLTYYNSPSDIGKYDTGSNERIASKQPYSHVALDQWGDRTFYAGYRAPYEADALEGTYKITSAVNRKYGLDAEKKGDNIQLYKEYGNAQQKFRIVYVDSGYYKIVCGNGKVVDVQSGKAKNRQNIHQYQWNGTKAQLWKMLKNSDGSVTFESALNEGYALDLSGAIAKNGRNIYLYKKNGTAAQKWFLN